MTMRPTQTSRKTSLPVDLLVQKLAPYRASLEQQGLSATDLDPCHEILDSTTLAPCNTAKNAPHTL